MSAFFIKNRVMIFLSLIIILLGIGDSCFGEKTVHKQILKQIEQNLQSEADFAFQILNSSGNQISANQISAQPIETARLQQNSVFIQSVLEQIHQSISSRKMDQPHAILLLNSILFENSKRNALDSKIIPVVSTDPTKLLSQIRAETLQPGEHLDISDSQFQDLIHTGNLFTYLDSDTSKQSPFRKKQSLWIQYDASIKHLITTRNAPSWVPPKHPESNVQNLKILAVASGGDLIIQQEDGFAIYSSTFSSHSNSDKSGVLVAYFAPESQSKYLKDLQVSSGSFSSVSLRLPDGSFSKRFCYIRYDASHQQYIIASMGEQMMMRELAQSSDPMYFIVLIDTLLMLLIVRWLTITDADTDSAASEGHATLRDYKYLRIGLIALSMLFVLFFQDLMRVQFLKIAIDEEYTQTLKARATHLKTIYTELQSETQSAREVVLSDYGQTALQSANSIRSTIQTLSSSHSKTEIQNILISMNHSQYRSFWIFNPDGSILASPNPLIHGMSEPVPFALIGQLKSKPSGIVLQTFGSSSPTLHGYGYYDSANQWYVFSFPPVAGTIEKLDALNTLKSDEINKIFQQFKIKGSAAVIDNDLEFEYYTQSEFVGRSVNTLQVEDDQGLAMVAFQKKSGLFEYMLYDPNSHAAKHRKAYVIYDPKTQYHFLVSYDITDVFKELNRNAFGFLPIISVLSVLLMAFNGVFILRQYIHTQQEEFQ